MVDPSSLEAQQYTVLGLAPGADRTSIRAAYRRLARQFHPDVNRSAGASDRMRELNAAYSALCDGPTPDTAPAASAPAHAASVTRPSGWPGSGPRTNGPAYAGRGAAPSFGGFVYRYATGAAGAATAPAGSTLLTPVNGVTIGIVAGLFGLVALFGVWAFAVAKPFSGAPVERTRVSSPAPAAQSTTSTLAAQASANAAANAAAARSNLTSTGTAVPSSAQSQPAPAPTTVAQAVAAYETTSATASQLAAESPSLDLQPQAAARQPQAPVNTNRVAVPAAAAPVTSAIPAVPAAQPNVNQHITAVTGQPSVVNPAEVSLAQTASRALSNYDKAWTGYANALRFAAAGSLASAAANAGSLRTAGAPLSAATFLSGDAQLTMARTLYFQQQLAWNGQTSGVLTAIATSNPTAPRPDAAKSVRADQRLRQAADLVAQAQASGAPANAGQVKTLLDEAEQLHRESVAEWAKLLSAL